MILSGPFDSPQWSGKQLLDYFSSDVRESKIAPLETISQLRVIEAKQAQQGGLQIVDMNLVLRDVIAEFIRLAVSEAVLHATASHPHGETVRVMIAPEEF